MLKRRGQIWHYDIGHNGQRFRGTTGTENRKEAQEFLDRLKVELWKPVRQSHTLADALKLWLRNGARSRNEKNAVRQFLHLYPNRPLAEVKGADIVEKLAGKSAATANRIATNIRAALNLAVAANYCEPIRIPRRKTAPGRIRWLTREEWDLLYAELPRHLQPMALFAVSTGLRWANVARLTWSQVDLERRVASVEAADVKNRRALAVPLSATAVAALQAVQGRHPTWCFSYAGKRIGSPKTGFASALARAGIENFTWHDLRHTWASWHVQNGTPLAVLKELGGWSSMDLVMRYSHLAASHVAHWADNTTAQTSHTDARAPVAQWIEQPPPKVSRRA